MSPTFGVGGPVQASEGGDDGVTVSGKGVVSRYTVGRTTLVKEGDGRGGGVRPDVEPMTSGRTKTRGGPVSCQSRGVGSGEGCGDRIEKCGLCVPLSLLLNNNKIVELTH